ncbi:MAG: poly-gamma-glutamate synthase PgsB [Oscillospiraceae bacterium]|nr:poly-gamma-glutamate synthase PgsB [Oscillospiraceae bacterium]
MTAVLLALAALWLALLVREKRRADRDRAALRHVVHVNGTRGKSTVSRLIDAGLRAGGLRVFCKTTGTDPMTIDVAGVEAPLVRRGRANIKEQLAILHRAAAQHADVLVVECMAVLPELQHTAQHQMLRADVGVITNVRRDHTDVMGDTLPRIARSLSNTIPRGGVLLTAETGQAALLQQRAAALGSRFVPVCPDGTEPDFDFPDNIALALAVCAELGVPRATALAGMRAFHRDPYALRLYRCGGAVFVNALSANDVQSSVLIWEGLRARFPARTLSILVNNRPDRGSRAQDMAEVCVRLRPARVLLLGAAQGFMRLQLRARLPEAQVTGLKNAAALDLAAFGEGDAVLLVGNIAGQGRALTQRLREEGEELVR